MPLPLYFDDAATIFDALFAFFILRRSPFFDDAIIAMFRDFDLFSRYAD